MNFWKSAAGVMEVELTSAEPETALEVINAAGIEISQIRRVGELVCLFRISRKDYPYLAAICQKRGETLSVIHKSGIFWTGKALLGRPVLLGGLACFLIAAVFVPTRVLFVRVEGNLHVPTELILSAAEECGITFGASRREVRSEKVKNALLSAVPQLQWAGVNTHGCLAVIHVRERTEGEKRAEENMVSSIVADRDGFVLSGTVSRGTGLFSEGQAVREGQVLISGYTDCGLCIQVTKAEGEIVAQTNRLLEAVMPSYMISRTNMRDVKHKYSLIVRKKRINLWKDSGISDTSCGRMYEEYYVTLPGGFQLPIALCIETFQFFETEASEPEQPEAESSLIRFAERYLTQQMIAGRIQSRVQTVCQESGYYALKGNYVCTEMIGRVQREQIGDSNGKVS